MSGHVNIDPLINSNAKIANITDIRPGAPLLIIDPPWYTIVFDWKFWLVIVIVVLVILWICYGGKKYEFVGTRPLTDNDSPNSHISDNIDSLTMANIERGERDTINREEIIREISKYNNSSNNEQPLVTFIDDFKESENYNINNNNNNYSTKNPLQDQPWAIMPNPETDPIPTFDYIYKDNSKRGRTPKKIKIPNPPKNIVQHTIAQIPIIDPSGSQIQVTASLLKDKNNVFKPRNGKRSRGEQICVNVMKERYGVSFDTYRPDFLKNPKTGDNLELDCYNPNLQITIEHEGYEFIFNGIAVEYNGIQHYIWPNFTGQSKEDFIYQREKDDFKREMCDKEGVYLIVVPYNISEDMIKDYIHYYLPENVLARGDYNPPK